MLTWRIGRRCCGIRRLSTRAKMLDFRVHSADKFGAGALAMPSPDRTHMRCSPMHTPIPELTPEQQARFWAKVDVRGLDDCWLWTASTNGRYGKFWINGRIYYSHRISLSLDGRDPRLLVARHKCDVQKCCNPLHLEYGTNTDNMQDMVIRGRAPRGFKNGTKTHPERIARGDRHGSRTKPQCVARGERIKHSKLTSENVVSIRKDIRSTSAIAKDYGISRSLVSQVKLRKVWTHVA